MSDFRIVFIFERREQVGAARMDPLPPTPGPLGAWYEHTWNGCSVAPSRRLDADTDSDAAELEQRHEADAHWNGTARKPERAQPPATRRVRRRRPETWRWVRGSLSAAAEEGRGGRHLDTVTRTMQPTACLSSLVRDGL